MIGSLTTGEHGVDGVDRRLDDDIGFIPGEAERRRETQDIALWHCLQASDPTYCWPVAFWIIIFFSDPPWRQQVSSTIDATNMQIISKVFINNYSMIIIDYSAHDLQREQEISNR